MRVAILGALHEFDEAYSVTRVMLDQVRMCQRAGHDVTLFVKQGFNQAKGTIPEISSTTLPGFMGRSMEVVRDEFADRFGGGVLEPFDAFLCHDLWFAPMKGWDGYREGIRIVAPRVKGTWFHWTHSKWRPLGGTPNGAPGHVFVALNHDAVDGIAKMYSVPKESIDVVWNTSDVTDLLIPEARRIVDQTRLLDCDLLGVLPFPIGRYDSKGIDVAMKAYAELAKKYRVNVMLCGGRADRTTVKIKALSEVISTAARGTSLKWWWAHEFNSKWLPCVPNIVVRNLMSLSNLFLWPTHSEACSLSIAEARTADALVVLPNKCVEGMKEFTDEDGLLVTWHDSPAGTARTLEPHLERHIRRLRRKWQWSRDGIWATQLKPMLERRAKGTW